jgi:hypothetical protein
VDIPAWLPGAGHEAPSDAGVEQGGRAAVGAGSAASAPSTLPMTAEKGVGLSRDCRAPRKRPKESAPLRTRGFCKPSS